MLQVTRCHSEPTMRPPVAPPIPPPPPGPREAAPPPPGWVRPPDASGPPPPVVRPPVHGPARPGGRRVSLAAWVAGLGALLLLAAAATFLAVSWEVLGATARIAIVGGLTAAAVSPPTIAIRAVAPSTSQLTARNVAAAASSSRAPRP